MASDGSPVTCVCGHSFGWLRYGSRVRVVQNQWGQCLVHTSTPPDRSLTCSAPRLTLNPEP